MNLRAFAKMSWEGIELAAHEVSAILDYAEKLVAARPTVLHLDAIGTGAKVLLGGIELVEEEIERIKTLARTLTSHRAPEEPTPTTGAPTTGV
jgi:hypothetical protein